MGGKIIDFNPKKLKQLKVRYNMALENKEESFRFERAEILTDYAKYLIEYLENKFNGNTQKTA